jgi:hypothetical protein
MSTASPFTLARRLEWVDGSALTWRDLRAGVDAEEAMLALHMRALHDTYGVALGLTTVLGTDQRSVLVTPGFAITCLGMTILLPTAQALAGPPATGIGVRRWDLLLEAPPLGAGDPCYRPTTCDLGVPPRLASVRWNAADEPVDQRTSVVLARYLRLPTGLLAGPDLSVRRGARALERPPIASGSVSGATWTTSGPRLVASIDTSAAGFTRPAIYRVWIASHGPYPPNVIGAFLSMVSASRTAIQLQLLIPGVASSIAQRVAAAITLGWLGIEPIRGCPPVFGLSHLFATPFNASLWTSALGAIPGFQP